MKKTDRMLFRMIQNSKGQFAAVVMIIVAGIAVFIALNMNAVNLEKTLNDYYDECDFADLFIMADDIPAQKIRDIETLAGVKSAEGRLVLEAPVITDKENERVNVRLITTKGEGGKINRCWLLEGRWPKPESREALVIEQFATARGISAGDKIRVQYKGSRYTLDVVGVAANPEFVYIMENAQSIMPDPERFGIVYIPELLGRQMSGMAGANEAVITYTDEVDEEALIKTLEKQLTNYGLTRIIKREDQMSNSVMYEEVTQLKRMSESLPVVFIGVAGLVLVMMLGRMVKRDRMKIGILKGLGYNNLNIAAHYTKYAAVTGIIGGVLGGLLGMACASGLTRVFLMYFHIPMFSAGFYPETVIRVVALAVIVCILAGLFGSRGVLAITPADSMKGEAPKPGKKTALEYIPPIWRRLPFSSKLVVKNVFRNKKRAGFVLAGISMTYAMMLFTTSMPGAIDYMMGSHYQEFQKMDYIIGLRAPVKESAVNDIRHIIDVEYMEPKLEYPFELENANRKQVISIIGIKKDTAFYTFRNLDGEIVEIPKSGMLITSNLANNLNLKAGDTVKLNTFISGKSDAYVEVKEIVDQALGINAYMDITYMSEKFLEKNAVNGIYLDSSDEEIYDKLIPVSNIASVMSMEETVAIFEEYMTMTNIMIWFMVIFSGILGFCVVYNATTIIIGEREMEFSALRVLGLSQNEIFKMILNENNIIMAAGILAGIPLGMSLLSQMSAAFSTDMYVITLRAGPEAVIYAALLTALFVFFAQFATYQRIKKLDLLSALKSRMS